MNPNKVKVLKNIVKYMLQFKFHRIAVLMFTTCISNPNFGVIWPSVDRENQDVSRSRYSGAPLVITYKG